MYKAWGIYIDFKSCLKVPIIAVCLFGLEFGCYLWLFFASLFWSDFSLSAAGSGGLFILHFLFSRILEDF